MIQKIRDFDLSAYNTFRMKVKCALFVEYDSIEDLSSLDFDSLPRPVMSIGQGANLLFTGDFPGTVLRSRICYMKYFDLGTPHVPIAAGAGVKFDDLIRKTCADSLWGLENLSAIPGSVGACAVQNVGAYGVEAKDIIQGVSCFDTKTGKKVSFKASECNFGYRDSRFKHEGGRYIITGVLFRLSREASPRLEYKGLQGIDSGSPQAVRDAVMKIRSSKLPDPEQIGSAGSFFKNPVVSAAEFASIANGYGSVPHYILEGGFIKVPAAWMIEQCGLKGFQIGGAAVHESQPLVLINKTGEALPEDVLELEKTIKERVRERFGVTLEAEVEHI